MQSRGRSDTEEAQFRAQECISGACISVCCDERCPLPRAGLDAFQKPRLRHAARPPIMVVPPPYA